MYFLIDFENVGSEGLKGAEYLLKEDTVIIFSARPVSRFIRDVFIRLWNLFAGWIYAS